MGDKNETKYFIVVYFDCGVWGFVKFARADKRVEFLVSFRFVSRGRRKQRIVVKRYICNRTAA
jgi:hypothetical protein